MNLKFKIAKLLPLFFALVFLAIFSSFANAQLITVNDTDNNLNTTILLNGTGFIPNTNYTIDFLLENKSSWWDGYDEQWIPDFTNITADANGNFSINVYLPWDWRMSGGKTLIKVGQNISSALVWWTQGTNWTATQPTKNRVTGDTNPDGLIYTASSATAANTGGVEGFFKANGTLFCRQNMTGNFNFNDVTNNGTIIYAGSSQTSTNLWRINQTNCSVLIGQTTVSTGIVYSVNSAPDNSYIIITSAGNLGPYKWSITSDPPTNITAFNAYRINSIAYDSCVSPDGTKVFIGYANGNVTALNSATGALIWNRNIELEQLGTGYLFPVKRLACDNDRVYIARSTVTNPTGIINQGFLEAVSPATGDRIWVISSTNTFHDDGDVNGLGCDNVNCYIIRNPQTVYQGVAGSAIMQINKTTGNVTWWNWRSWLPQTYSGTTPNNFTAIGQGATQSIGQSLFVDSDATYGAIYAAYTNGWVQKIMKNDVNAQTFDPSLWIRGDTNFWNYVADVTKNIWLSNETPIYNFQHWNYQGFPLDTNATQLSGTYFRFGELSSFNDFSVTDTPSGLFIDPVIGQLVPTQRNEVQYFFNNSAGACLPTRYYPNATGWHYQDRWCRYEEIPATLTGYNIGTTINGTYIAGTTWSLIKTKFYDYYPITEYYGNDNWAWGVEHNASNNQVLGFAVKFGSDQEDVWSDTQGRAVNWLATTAAASYIRPYYRADLNRESDMYLFLMPKGAGPPTENFTWSKVDLETQKIANPISITFTSDETQNFTPGGGTFTNRRNITAQEPNLMDRTFEPTEIIFNATGGIKSDCQDVMITDNTDTPIALWQVDNYTACSQNNNVSVWVMLNWTQNETKQLSLYYNGSVVLPTGTTDLNVSITGAGTCAAGTAEYIINSTNWYSWKQPAAATVANEVVNYNFNRPVPATPENLFAATPHYSIFQCYRNSNTTTNGQGVITSDTCSPSTAVPKSRCVKTGLRNNTIFVHLNASTDANALGAIGGGRGTTTNTLFTEYYFFANTGRIRIRTQLNQSLPIINVTVSKNWPPYYYFSIASFIPGTVSGLQDWVYYSGLYDQMKKPVATYNGDRTQVNLSSSPLPLLFTVNYGNINQWGDFNASIERPSTLTDSFWGAGCTAHKMTQSYIYTGGPATQTGYTSEFISCSRNVSQLPAMGTGGFVNVFPKMQWWGTSYNKWSDPFLVGKFYMMPNAYRPYNRENRFLTPYATNIPYYTTTGSRISSYIIPRCPEKEYGYNGYQDFLNDLDNMLANTSLWVTTNTQNISCAAEIIRWTDQRGSDGTNIIFARNLTVIVGEVHSAGEPTPSNTFAPGTYAYQADGTLDYTFAQKGSATAGQLGKWYFTYTPYNYTINAFATSGNPQFMNTPYSTADSYKIRYDWAPESPYNKVVFDESALWSKANQNFSYYRNPCWLGRYDDAFGGTETLNTPRPPGWQHEEWGGGSSYTYSATCPHNTYNMEIQDVFRPGWSSKGAPATNDAGAYNELLIFGRQNKPGNGTAPNGNDTYYVAGHNSLSDGPHSDDYSSVLDTYSDLNQGVKQPNQEPWYCIISRHTNRSFCIMESSLSSYIYNYGPPTLTQSQPFSPYWQSVRETTAFRNYFNLRFGDTSAWNVPTDHYVELNIYPTAAKSEVLYSNLLLATNDPDEYTKSFQQQFPFAQNAINQNQFLLQDWQNSAFFAFDKDTRTYSPGQTMNITGLLILNGSSVNNADINLSIYRNDGTSISNYTTTTNSSGYFNWSYSLPTNTSDLHYVLLNYNNGQFTDSAPFTIGTYAVTILTNKSNYADGDGVSINYTIHNSVNGSLVNPSIMQQTIKDSSGTIIRCAQYPSTTPTCSNLMSTISTGLFMDTFAINSSSMASGTATITLNLTDNSGFSTLYYSTFRIEQTSINVAKNAQYLSENDTSVTYNLTVQVTNSGGEDLTGITVMDSDLNLNTLVNLNQTQSYSASGTVTIGKLSESQQYNFSKTNATYDAVTYESNEISVLIPSLSEYETGYNAGYIAGNETGYITGFNEGNITGFDLGNITGFIFGNSTGFTIGNTTGFSLGNSTGFILGNSSGFILGNATGFILGNSTGFILGNETGFIFGNITGYDNGNYTGFILGNYTGFILGNLTGFNFGNETGYETGYNAGYIAGNDTGYITGFNFGNITGFNFGNMTGFVFGNSTGFDLGNITGFIFGNSTGFVLGNDSGFIFGNATGFTFGNYTGFIFGNYTGFIQGNITGFDNGNNTGFVLGNYTGFIFGNETGFDFGNETGFKQGNETGYNAGFIVGNDTGYLLGFDFGNITGFDFGNETGFVFGNSTGFDFGNETGYSLGNSTGFVLGNSTGFVLGNATGFSLGNITGFIFGNETGYEQGNITGFDNGNNTGFTLGNYTGFIFGNITGFNFGNETGFEQGNETGYESGYISGFNEGNISGFNLGNITGFIFGNDTGFISGYNLGNESGFSLGNTTGFVLGNETGYIEGNATGFTSGNYTGFIFGNSTGFTIGNITGFNDGNNTGFILGNYTGFILGNITGFDFGNETGFKQGNETGYETGYSAGYIAGNETGYISGFNEGNITGFDLGNITGFNDGNNTGFIFGNSTGFNLGNYTGFIFGNSTGFVLGNDTGFILGNATGFILGNSTGFIFGNETGFILGNITGYDNGNNTGFILGNYTGFVFGNLTGFNFGNETGYNSGFEQGNATGYETGYLLGFDEGNITGFDFGNVTGFVFGNSTGFDLGNLTGFLFGNTTGFVLGNETGFIEGNAIGFTLGNSTGFIFGNETGFELGNITGFDNGNNTGFTLGNYTGFIFGNIIGFNFGNETGFIQGNSTGFEQGNETGYSAGYSAGYITGNETGYLLGFNEGNITGFDFGNITGFVFGNSTGFILGNSTGFIAGNETGFVLGNSTGFVLGNETGFIEGNATGFTFGNYTGFIFGNETGFIFGNITGFNNGNNTGFILGNYTGFILGNITGFDFGQSFSATGQQLTLVKNIYFNSESPTSMNYTVTIGVINSGGVDLTEITVLDSDLGLSQLISLNRTQSYNYSRSISISKAASNTEKTFAQSTATVNSTTYFSNQISIGIPGYGGPADITVDAPISVSAFSPITAIINITNKNLDIGQDFAITYWITSNDESANYSSGQKTIYVAASSSNTTTADLTSPSDAGTYKFEAVTTWTGGSASAYDSFSVSAVQTTTTSAPIPQPSGGGVILSITTTTSSSTTTTTTIPVVVSETKTFSIPAGSSTAINIAKSDDLKIQQIEITVKNDVTNVQIRVKESSLPSGASPVIPLDMGAVYKYLEITESNINDSDISKVKIAFKVERSWMAKNLINLTTVSLNKYENGGWNNLSAKLLSSDDSYYYFEAESSSLSIYAIAGEKIMIKPLFDIVVKIPSQYKTVLIGDDILTQFTLLNVEHTGLMDVIIEYGIEDLEGNLITTKQDTIAVEKQTSFLTVLELPSTSKPGDYIVFGRVRYDSSVASGSDSFKAVLKNEIGMDQIILFSQIIVILILVMIIVLVLNLYKKRRGKHKSLINKLTKELESIELSFKHGLIDEIEFHEKKAVLLKKLKKVDKKIKKYYEENLVKTIKKLKEGM